ncbi:MAG: DUF1573 domain-containing protein [Planctomycetaceae bacterium]|jgi:hypothetical protein|nr:DUF1573 domain-containing protein [Planctomycetaceae bacterium]
MKKFLLILLCVHFLCDLGLSFAQSENESNTTSSDSQNETTPQTDQTNNADKTADDDRKSMQLANADKFVKPTEDWTEHVISKSNRQFNFRSVPFGKFSEYKFILSNPFQEVLHIAEVSSSCSCTSAFVLDGKDTLQTYDKTAIVARLQSVDHSVGQKNATITIRIDKPLPAVIQLNTHAWIRSDISFSISELRFDSVESGEEKTRTLTVDYKGRNSAWRIVDAKCTNPHIEPQIEATQVYPNQITATIKVKLKSDMPNGEFTDRLVLISNESAEWRELPVVVRGRVGVTISVAPETVFFGYLKSGEASTTKSVLLKGSQPFKITKFICDNPAVQCVAELDANSPAKQIHLLPLRYTNPATGDGKPVNGKMEATVKIETDLNNLTPKFKVLMESIKD